MTKAELKAIIKTFSEDDRKEADRSYMRYWQKLHRLKGNETMMELSRSEYIYYFLLWEDMRDLFSQLNKKPTERRTRGAIHFSSSSCRFITPLYTS